MASLVVKPVETRAERRRFLSLPWTIYRDDPCWIPPLRKNQHDMVGYGNHPFYARNTAQTFLAYRDGRVCGRIAAILNVHHNLRFNERRGFFGFFECENDQEAADGLFTAVRQWFADQGVYCLRGPCNPSLNYELGLLVDGFASPPMFMMTYNPPYYQQLIENYGFKKTQDMYAFWGNIEMLPKLQAKLQPVAEQIIERYNVVIRALDRRRFREDVMAFLEIYNRALVNTWGFVPMTKAEIDHTADALKHLIVPELAVGAEIDGRMVGASFALPDYNPRIKAIDGRLFPFGFLRLLMNKSAIKRVRIISTNVLPEYQRMGIGLVLMHGLLPAAMKWKLEEAEFSWVLESNSLSRGALQKGGAIITKTYRLYDLDDPAAAATGSPRPHRRLIVGPGPSVPLTPDSWCSQQQSQQATGAGFVSGATAASGGRPCDLVPVSAESEAGRSTSMVAASRKIEVIPVADRKLLDLFVRVPWSIYRRDPHWVPPLISEVREFLDPRRHPFYRHGAAQPFVALRGGEPVGRILASDDPNYNRHAGENLGCFGMFESIDDRPVAHALLDAAAQWVSDRGRNALRGPIDYSTNYSCGLLVDGFEWPPRAMMNHNPIYYADLLESWGLVKAKDLYAYWFEDPQDIAARLGPRAERIAERTGVRVRPFRREDFDAEVARCRQVYNQAMSDNWGAVPLTEEEFLHMAHQLRKLTVPEFVLLAEIDQRAVGFSITIPDFNEAIRPLNGRLTQWGLPINAIRLMRRMKRITTARMLVLDVVNEYRHRGVAALMILRVLEFGKYVLGHTGAELGWTLEDNTAINRTIEGVGARRYKTYRIYEKRL